MYIRRTALVLGLVLFAFGASAASKGTFTANGKKVNLSNGYAANRKNPFDKTKTDVFLVFTDKEIPAEAIFDDFGLMGLADKGISGVTVQIAAENKRANSGTMFSPNFKKMKQFSVSGSQKVEITSWTKDRVAGTVSIPADDFFDETYEYSVTFDLPIVSKPAPKPLPGTKLPAGGGDPGKAYEAYRKVIAAGDIAGIRKLVIPEMAKQTEGPEFKEMLPVIQAMSPKKIKITGGSVDGDNATLLVDSLDEKNTHGTITMRREAGQWKLAKESWKSGGSE
jgi:hypothetical protein